MEEKVRFIREKEDEMVDVLRSLVEFESPSLDKTATDQMGQIVARLFEEYTGGTATVIPNKKYGNHIRGEWGDGDEQILLLAHFDTVWRKGDIKRMPFRVEDGKAYGPGTFDMKGGIVQGIFALHALKELNQKIGSKVVFLFTSDEEIGSDTSKTLIQREASKSKCVFVLEPAMSTKGALKTSRKGVGLFKLKISGKAAHAGIDPENGNSAIVELAHQIQYLDGLTDYEVGTTINVGVVKGGTTSNVVAAESEADIDLRVKTQAEFNRVVPLIQNLSPITSGTIVEVTGGVNRPPLEKTEQVTEKVKLAKTLAKKYLDEELLEMSTGGGSDGNFTAQFAPTLDGLGAVGDGAHAIHEHLITAQMPVRSALVALLLERLG